MNERDLARVRRALRDAGAPAALQLHVMNVLQADNSAANPDAAWQRILRPLDDCIKAMRNTRTRWRASRAPTYAAYLTLLERVHGNISVDMGLFATPAQAAANAAAANAARASAGQRPLATKDGSWITWVPEHIRQATVQEFERLYALEAAEGTSSGRRVTPFATLYQRKTILRKWEALADQLFPYFDAITRAEKEGSQPETIDVERARAAHAAKRIIDEHIKALKSNKRPTEDNLTVPVTWTSLLHPDTRARLRDAEAAHKELLRAETAMVSEAEPNP